MCDITISEPAYDHDFEEDGKHDCIATEEWINFLDIRLCKAKKMLKLPPYIEQVCISGKGIDTMDLSDKEKMDSVEFDISTLRSITLPPLFKHVKVFSPVLQDLILPDTVSHAEIRSEELTQIKLPDNIKHLTICAPKISELPDKIPHSLTVLRIYDMSVTKIPQSKSLWGLTIGNAQKRIDELDLRRYPEFKYLFFKNTEIGTKLTDRRMTINKYVERLVINLPIAGTTSGTKYMIMDGEELPIPFETYGYFETFCHYFGFG